MKPITLSIATCLLAVTLLMSVGHFAKQFYFDHLVTSSRLVVNDKNTTIVLKQNLKENESTYAKIKTFEHEMSDELKSNDTAHHEYFNLGSTIADMLTSYWNSKENPSKVYLFNRRVHHGTIGALFGFVWFV